MLQEESRMIHALLARVERLEQSAQENKLDADNDTVILIAQQCKIDKIDQHLDRLIALIQILTKTVDHIRLRASTMDKT
jgi:uncharacterized coiled-coil protein SlyX